MTTGSASRADNSFTLFSSAVAGLACDVQWSSPFECADTPYGYKGQWGYYTDGETGLLLLTHRYLDPAMGRFLTRDPIGFEGGINLYAYVGNWVMDAYDPTGTVVRFCYRPVIKGIRGKPACHWFLWTSCGVWGYGPGGITKTCLGNLGDFGVEDVTCEVLPSTDSQEKCICDNARNAEREWVLCGRVWKRSKKTKHGWSHYDWPGLGCADNPNCQDFVNCLLKKCGLPTQHMTQCEAQGGPRGGNYIIY
jgi:RHS repeat-associated protein